MKNNKNIKVWKAIYVSSRAEMKVKERLQAKGIQCYVPCRKVMKQWSDRKKMIVEPLLPGYVFVYVSESIKLPVLETQGVVAFVRNLGSDAVIRNAEIETLRTIEKLGYDISAVEKDFRIGELIKITDGILKGNQAEVVEIANDGTLFAFLLQEIGQCLYVKIPKEIAESID